MSSHAPLRRALVALAVAATVASGCSSAASSSSGPSTTAAGSPTTAATSSSTAPAPAAGYAVGSRSVTWVDHTRPTKGDANRKIAAADSRTLPVLLVYPATGAPDARHSIHAGAKPADGHFPIVVFSHGVTANGPIYAGFVAPWAAAGYVVALPTYPMTSGPGAWADLGEYTQQPADVSFIITQLIKLDSTAGDPLAGRLDTADVGIGGHSLGAITSLGLLNSCCVDRRVKAIVAISGSLLPFPGGSFDAPPAVPLLMVHGEKDTTVPYETGSKRVFAQLTPVPRGLVSYPGASHVSLVFGAESPSTEDAIIDFLNLELRHDPSGWKGLDADLAQKGVGSLAVAGALPQAS